MATTVADVMVATLKASGVRRMYGIPGDSLNGFMDALRRDGGIAWEHVRHEEAAGFAAAAEAALTGELAVCAGSCGPGNLHLINGPFDANRSRVPVLAIAAHIPEDEIGGADAEHSDDDRRPRTYPVPPLAWLARHCYAASPHRPERRADCRCRSPAVRDLGPGASRGLGRRRAHLPPDHLADHYPRRQRTRGAASFP